MTIPFSILFTGEMMNYVRNEIIRIQLSMSLLYTIMVQPQRYLIRNHIKNAS